METFQKAIAKAESAFGLVSAPDAVLIRWVQSAAKAKQHGGVSQSCEDAEVWRWDLCSGSSIALRSHGLDNLIQVEFNLTGSALLFLLGYMSW